MSTTTARRNSARAKADARRRARRRQLLTIVGASVAVLAVVAVIVVIATVGGGGSKDTVGTGRTSGAAALAGVTSLPAATLDQVGAGTTTALPQPVDEPDLTRDGKPLVLYVGAEYCPYCAAQRWPFVQALSRFGTWSNLDLTRSATDDVFPNTPTFTFHGATYTSKWLSFSGKELFTSEVRGDGYVPLDKLTAEEERLFTSHTQAFPFIDLGGHFIINGAMYKPEVLKGLTALGIAEAMTDPSHPLAKAVDGSANVITAALCHVTGNQPANVCTAPPVAAITRALTR